MAKHVKKISIQAIGFAFILLGVAGLVLPVLNGTIFLIAGLFLLSVYSPRAKLLIKRIGDQHPQAEKLVLKIEKFMHKYIGEV